MTYLAGRPVVAVTFGGFKILEMATRAKTQLILILVEAEREDFKKYFADYHKHFQVASDRGLVELLVNTSANENKNERENKNGNENENENENKNENERESKCNPCCTIS